MVQGRNRNTIIPHFHRAHFIAFFAFYMSEVLKDVLCFTLNSFIVNVANHEDFFFV